MVLLVVDTQRLITTPDLYNFNVFGNAIKTLIVAARENNVHTVAVVGLQKDYCIDATIKCASD